jgi:L-ascorbate metabolism protein UlaG (beta-lactamase superfamily)
MASVVTDPYDASVGLNLPRTRADIITVSQDDPACGNVQGLRGPYRVLDTPGEYEIGDVFTTGIATFTKGETKKRNIIFHFDYEGLTVCHLGHLSHVPTQAQVEALGAVDVLLVPVGGDSGLEPAQASEVVSLLEPAIVIPMRYKIPNLTLPLGTLERFLKQMGREKVKSQDTLKITQTSLPSETEIVVLNSQAE